MDYKYNSVDLISGAHTNKRTWRSTKEHSKEQLGTQFMLNSYITEFLCCQKNKIINCIFTRVINYVKIY